MPAHAELLRPTLRSRLSTTLFFSVEHEPLGAAPQDLATPSLLLYGDLRWVLDARRFAHDRVDLRIDVRLRGTGNLENQDWERKFLEPSAQSSISARGYVGGPEYDLRELYVDLGLTPRSGPRPISLRLGRQYIPESDAFKIDGLRIAGHFSNERRWEVGAFIGGAPNQYSRSLLTDYTPPCGAGVASDAQGAQTIAGSMVAVDPCVTKGPQLALAGGIFGDYRYQMLWGSLGLTGAFYGGDGDGGPVLFNGQQDQVSNLLPPVFARDSARIFLNWVNQISLVDPWSLFANLVVDFVGSHGTQLTRALLVNDIRVLRDGRLGLRLAYSYMSSLAVDMYLTQQLYNRLLNGTTLGGVGVIENNLTVQRTGRHEVRLGISSRLVERLSLFAEGRFRQRTLLDDDRNPAVFQNAQQYGIFERTLASDATLGLRDEGSHPALRGLATYTFLQDFRALSHLLRLSLGAMLWKKYDAELRIDFDYGLLLTTDEGAGQTQCDLLRTPLGDPASRQSGQVTGQNVAFFRLNNGRSYFLPDCFGRRSGQTHEAGLVLSHGPQRGVYVNLDYRFSALLTDPEGDQVVNTVFNHALLMRIEWQIDKRFAR